MLQVQNQRLLHFPELHFGSLDTIKEDYFESFLHIHFLIICNGAFKCQGPLFFTVLGADISQNDPVRARQDTFAACLFLISRALMYKLKEVINNIFPSRTLHTIKAGFPDGIHIKVGLFFLTLLCSSSQGSIDISLLSPPK